MKDEDELIEFFSEWRKEDDKIAPPPFKKFEKKKTIRLPRFLIPIGVAASILIFGSMYFFNEPIEVSDIEDLVIILTKSEDATTESLLVSEASIYDWEAPTNTLLDDF